MTTYTMSGTSVFLGMPAGRDLPVLTVKSLLATQQACRARGIDLQIGMVANSAVVQWARDEVVDLFMASGCEHLFWVDSDMVWEPEQFLRLLVWNKSHDVVCAAYPAKVDQPTFYVHYDKSVGLVPSATGLVEINGLGLGFTVMSRQAVTTLVDAADKVFDEVTNRTLASIFRIGTDHRGCRQGEDMAFFFDLRRHGYQAWLDPSIDLGHVGSKTYRGTIRDAM